MIARPPQVDYDDIREYLKRTPIEGIVYHGPDGRMAKIKRRDFAIGWPLKTSYAEQVDLTEPYRIGG